MDCSHPSIVKVPNTRKRIPVPCGHCIACRIRKTSEWKLRLMMENDCWSESSFLTLTYDEEHLPLTPCGHMTLWPDHLKDFLKRVRINLHRWKMKNDEDYKKRYLAYRSGALPAPPPLLRYYACGEYGDRFSRPHYHVIIFGSYFKHKGDWWIHHYEGDKRVYTSNELIDLWPYGLPTVDSVIPQRCAYVAGYVQKKIYYDHMKYFKEYGCSVYPFSRQSQGLGLKYLEKHRDFFYRNGNIRPVFRGVSYTVPRYFLKKDEKMKCDIQALSNQHKSENMLREQEYYDLLYEGVYAQKERELKSRSKLKR